MSLTKFTGATNWIRSLINKPTKPASELKEDFDKAGDLIKTYINETLTEEIDTQLENKANNSDVYSKTEANTLLGEKANSADVYTKTESDTLLGNKANNSDVYSKTETDTLLGNKANSADVYTKTQSNTNFKANGDFTVISGSHIFDGTTKYFNIPYPSGFNKDNSVIISTGKQYNEHNILVNLLNDVINVQQDDASAIIYIYKIVLMKV